ncbi:MAG: outer membrane beta-barrel protein [Gammaproteobacteria bacterium]|nr:outer membrane beta-barrel protein [Gammaproteobacteria bacterium]
MKLPLALLVSGMLLAASSASAADSGAFMGVGVGQVNIEIDDLAGSGYQFDENDTGYKLFAGYKFMPWLSVEGAYVDGGNPGISATEGGVSAKLNVEVQSLVASVIFTLPVGDNFELFIKPGIAYWDAKTTASYSDSFGSDRASDSDDGTAFFIGGGAAFKFSENFGMRIEYEYFEVAPEYDDYYNEFVDTYDASAGFLSASFVYSF